MISEYTMCTVSGALKSKAYKGAIVRYKDSDCRMGALIEALTSGDVEMADLSIECLSYYPVFFIREELRNHYYTSSLGSCVRIWTAP